MSLSYTGSHRSSLGLGYISPSSISNSSSTSSSTSSRPRSSYTSGSSVGKLDYGSATYGHLGRHDSTSSRTYVASSRRSDLYTPTSSISSRSSTRHNDSGSRASTETSAYRYASSASGRGIGGRRDSSHSEVVSPLANFDVSSSYETLNRLKSDSRSYESCRAGGNKEGGDVPSSASTRVSTHSSKVENVYSKPSSSVDSDYYSRQRERRKEIQENEVLAASREEKISSLRGTRRQSGGQRDEKPDKNIEIKNDDSRQLEKAILYKSTKDSEELKTLNNFQKTRIKIKERANDTEHDKVFVGDVAERVKESLCDPSVSDAGGEHSSTPTLPVRASLSSRIKTRSTEASNLVHQEKPSFVTPADLLLKSQADPSEARQCSKDTYSTKTLPKPHLSNVEEIILQKSAKMIETSEGPEGTSGSGEEQGIEDLSRKPRANGVIKASTNSARTANSIAASAAQAEIIRLESLCEARTKELTHTKMHLRDAVQAFDAMAVLANYCCSDLNAFECPPLARKLNSVQKQLTDCLSEIAEVSSQRDALEKNLQEILQEKDEALKKLLEAYDAVQKERDEHARITREMDDTHNAALTTQRDELTFKQEENVKKFSQFYDRQIDLLRMAHDRQMSDMKNESKLEMNALKISHLEEIQELRNKHDGQMEELHKQHRNKLEDITHRFESIKLTLSEKVETLRGECDDLARRARSSEDALQRDADAKVQIALAPYLTLPKEIESLKMVLEMRNEEIQKLRTKNMDIEKQLAEIPIARERIISLQQKVENLEAIINIKTDHEKQLHEKCQILMRKYDRESRANKRLSMDYEQVVWRMSQSSEFGSCESLTKRHFSRSPPRSKEGSPDSRQRTMSPNTGEGDVVMRVKKRSSHSLSEGDRKLRARSATFVLEKSESSGGSDSPSLSPQVKHKRWRKKSQAEEVAAESQGVNQMCHSAESEIMADPPRQKQQVEQKDSGTLKDVIGAHVITSSDMASSYARSLSGVSDSGMYDSMTRSDVLGSSIVSTDSEWGTSVNLSLNCDSTVDDAESGPVAGDYHSQINLMLVASKGSLSDTDSGNVAFSNTNSVGSSNQRSSSESQNEDDKESSCYELHLTLPHGPGATDDNVFEERGNIDSC